MNRWVGTIGVMALIALTTPAHADEVWVAPTYQADLGGVGIGSNGFWPVTVVGAVRLAWAIPNNLQTFQSAKVVLIPHSPGGAANLNVFICPAQNTDPVAGACAGPFAQPFTGIANQLLEVDVSTMVAPQIGTPGATYLAVVAYTTPTTTTDHIVGLRFAYAPTVPEGAATLGANTFSGTLTAPAFVGDGSGLTNIPPGPVGPPGPQGPPGPAGGSVIERPLPVTFDGTGYIIVDVESGPDAFTTVRIFNNSGSDQAIIMTLFSSSSGVLLAECINERVQNRQTVDWCIQPSDFGADRFATLRIRPFGGTFQESNAVSAFVTKFTP